MILYLCQNSVSGQRQWSWTSASPDLHLSAFSWLAAHGFVYKDYTGLDNVSMKPVSLDICCRGALKNALCGNGYEAEMPICQSTLCCGSLDCRAEVKGVTFFCIDLILAASAWHSLVGCPCQALAMTILLPCQHCAWPDIERTEVLAERSLANTHTHTHNAPETQSCHTQVEWLKTKIRFVIWLLSVLSYYG